MDLAREISHLMNGLQYKRKESQPRNAQFEIARLNQPCSTT